MKRRWKMLIAAFVAGAVCSSFTPMMNVEAGNQEITAFAEVEENGILYSILEGEAIVTGYTGNPVNVVIPSQVNGATVTEIGMNAFRDCTSLQKIELPATIEEIQGRAIVIIDLIQAVVNHRETVLLQIAAS